MAMSRRGFFLGLIVGVGLTTIAIDRWASFMRNELVDLAQPKLRLDSVKSSDALPQPWFPDTSGSSHAAWRVQALNGGQLTLADLTGNVVFLDFWSTTCYPCIAEMPGIEHLYESLKKDNVVFLAITIDDEKQVRDFLRKHPLGVPVYLAKEEIPKDLQSGLPTTFILDRRGIAVFKHVGAVDWDTENALTFIRGLSR
jgi:thiol-disulfide isomerase/thioredoxin